MADVKQPLLPLWGSAANARAVHMAAVQYFNELCEAFVDADFAKDEGRMDSLCEDMRAVIIRIEGFKRRQFRLWAKEREAKRS